MNELNIDRGKNLLLSIISHSIFFMNCGGGDSTIVDIILGLGRVKKSLAASRGSSHAFSHNAGNSPHHRHRCVHYSWFLAIFDCVICWVTPFFDCMRITSRILNRIRLWHVFWRSLNFDNCLFQWCNRFPWKVTRKFWIFLFTLIELCNGMENLYEIFNKCETFRLSQSDFVIVK